jgi:Arc/MetJ-type ribon-helix-helix transcriptional regulator
MNAARGRIMATSKIKLRLNQQQIELIDNTIRAGESNSRDDLVRRALREFAKANLPKPEKENDVD